MPASAQTAGASSWRPRCWWRAGAATRRRWTGPSPPALPPLSGRPQGSGPCTAPQEGLHPMQNPPPPCLGCPLRGESPAAARQGIRARRSRPYQQRRRWQQRQRPMSMKPPPQPLPPRLPRAPDPHKRPGLRPGPHLPQVRMRREGPQRAAAGGAVAAGTCRAGSGARQHRSRRRSVICRCKQHRGRHGRRPRRNCSTPWTLSGRMCSRSTSAAPQSSRQTGCSCRRKGRCGRRRRSQPPLRRRSPSGRTPLARAAAGAASGGHGGPCPRRQRSRGPSARPPGLPPR
mmetsp:Transcript_25143/g.70244  ORF Transcript_25143/g.70244 Transcript_25143/m.70244 type:complete len:287 (+) Transcript_25143:2720-3580(+)